MVFSDIFGFSGSVTSALCIWDGVLVGSPTKNLDPCCKTSSRKAAVVSSKPPALVKLKLEKGYQGLIHA